MQDLMNFLKWHYDGGPSRLRAETFTAVLKRRPDEECGDAYWYKPTASTPQPSAPCEVNHADCTFGVQGWNVGGTPGPWNKHASPLL